MYQWHDVQVRWLGHDGFQLRNDNQVIYIDPYKVPAGQPADYILITHEHGDHFDRETIDRLKQINTVNIGPKSVTDQLDEMAIPLAPGEHFEAKGFTVQATAAYNTDKRYHPKDEGKLGYIIEIAGQRLYHAGDTDLIPEMDELGPIDLALLPVSGKYVMTAEQAVEAVAHIKPRAVIPMHYGDIIGTVEDAERFKKLVRDTAEVNILTTEPATEI